jgi:hypothetical protein
MAKIEEPIDWSKYGDHFSFAWASEGGSVISITRRADGQIRVDAISAYSNIETIRIDYANAGRLIGYVHDGKISIIGAPGDLVTNNKQILYGASSSAGSFVDALSLPVAEQTSVETGVVSYYMGKGANKEVPIKNVGDVLPDKGSVLFEYSIPQNGTYVNYNWSAGLTDSVSDSFTFAFDDDTKCALFKSETPYTQGVETRGYNLVNVNDMPSEMLKAASDIVATANAAPIEAGEWIAWHTFNVAGMNAVDGNPIVFLDLIMTSNLSEAQRYVQDGTIPSDARVNPSHVKKDTDSNEDGEDGGKSSTFDENEPSAPTVNSVKLSNLHNYWISESQMQSFYSEVWETDLTDFVKGAFTGIYSNLISNVVSLKFMPTTAENLGGIGDTSPVILGFKTYDDLTVQTIGNTTAPIVNIGSYKFSKEYNSFADYAPYTDVKLYLPFVGVVPIDTNLFMGAGGGETATLNIKAQYDLQSGLITYFLMRNKTMISSVSGHMAVEVPISLQSGLDTFSTISRNFSGKVWDFAMEGAKGNPIGMISEIAQGSATAPPQTIFASTGGDGSFYAHPKCMIMIKHPQYNRPKNYSHVVGFPAYVTKKISDLQGFNIVQNPVIPLADGMTGAEHDMIVTAMQSGLYY